MRFRKQKPDERAEPKPDAAYLARQRAQDDLTTARKRWPEVNRVTDSLREIREQNHFAASIAHIIGGGTR